jgi:hypothetical protein
MRTGFSQEVKLGDVRDGSRSPHVHVIDLLDEEGTIIYSDDKIPMPFSPKQTCLKCHDYHMINGGWHFNAADPEVSPGRSGEPWILTDPVSATQVPISFRNWSGTFKPEQFGLSPFQFTEKFGRHLAGGGVSENDSTESSDIYIRWQVSGKLEINCLSCHDAEASHDQAGYDLQIRKQNFRWAAAATSGFASVYGSAKAMPDNYDLYSGAAPDISGAVPPSIVYKKERFNDKNKIIFNIVREIPDQRCYFCHSATHVDKNRKEPWAGGKDVHLANGLTCVDCHRNGLDHSMTRGYESESEDINNPTASVFSCAGCHIEDRKSDSPQNGRLGAPNPSHKGLPEIHFEKLSCTACHSGPWPSNNVRRVKLSRTHALGTHIVKRGDDVAPYIQSPVYAKDSDGKIAPQRMIWPAYWAFLDGENIIPITPEDVQKISLSFVLKDSLTDSINVVRLIAGEWPKFSEKQVLQILDSLKIVNPDKGTPVYIGGGKLFSAADTALMINHDHSAARPYTWAFAHDVRPAEQSLGIRGCSDCHSIDASFSFGEVKAPMPFDFAEGSIISMTSLQEMDDIYPRAFALTFLFRPLLKNLLIICCIIILLVLLLYTLKGLEAVLKKWSDINS